MYKIKVFPHPWYQMSQVMKIQDILIITKKMILILKTLSTMNIYNYLKISDWWSWEYVIDALTYLKLFITPKEYS